VTEPAWQTAKLDEMATVARGRSRHRPRNAEHLYGGPYPFVQTGEVKAAEFWIRGTEQTYSEAGLEQSRLWPAGTVCMTIAANIAESGMLAVDACFPDSVVGVAPLEGVADASYLKYALDFMKFRLQAVSGGTTQDNLSTDKLLRFDFPAPPLRDQRQIASALRCFDDLIENNRRRIEISEEMARLLYREWFVHFRFPGHEDVEMVDSELGPIPEGWEVARLPELCSLVMGQSPKSEFYNDFGDGLPFHQGVTDFGFRFPSHRKWTTVDKRVAEQGDILFSVRAPVGRINVAPDRLVVGRGLSAIRAKDGRQEFMLLQLKDRFAVEDSIGGGTIFNAVTKTDMERIELLRPTSEVAEAFEAAVVPLVELGENLTKQNRVLREARDLLLPRLVSGELDVSELDVSELELDGVLA